MDISECHWMLTTAKLEKGREAGHCTQDVTSPAGKFPHESEAITKAAELNGIRDKRAHTEDV